MSNMWFGTSRLMDTLWAPPGGFTPVRDRCDCDWARTDATRLPWAADYSGWGGADYFGTDPGVTHTPIVFVHGNGRDACDWEPVAAHFRADGYTGDELWAITFQQATPTHAEMARQLDDFIGHVRATTGAETVTIIAHSLGVTGTRYWLADAGRTDWVDSVIGLAGANHGLPACEWLLTGLLDQRHQRLCQFLTDRCPGTAGPTLGDLNANETPADIDYYTIRGKYDTLFYGRRDSPALDGAVENVVLPTDHDGVRTSDAALQLLAEWTD